MNTILLIGAGNIGSRHLQGLALLQLPVSVIVVDPVQASLGLAKARFEEVYKGTNITIIYQTDLSFQVEKIEVAILATNSKIRRNVFEQLIGKVKVENVVFEKFLFQDLDDYEAVSALLKKHQIKAWVNCPRRMFEAYHTLKQILRTEDHFEFSVSGSDWGLGCNCVHYLDLYAFLTGISEIETSGVFLDKEIIPSKREGYIEFTGSLLCKDINGNTCTITSYKKEQRAMNITIHTERYQILILERGGDSKISITDKKEGLKSSVESFSMPYQSQLSNVMVEDILTKGGCALPAYETSRAIHESVLKAFISFLQDHYNDKNIKSCPVT